MWNGPRRPFKKRKNVWSEADCPQKWKKPVSVWRKPAFGKKLPVAIANKAVPVYHSGDC
jgi:hypothetical protein